MCFAPYISLTTFVIEFLLALYFLLSKPKDRLNLIIAAISFMLGFYQLNEFLICVTDLTIFTKLAMIATAIMPAMAITYALIMGRKQIASYWHMLIYAPAVTFMILFALPFFYKTSAQCMTVFIEYPGTGVLGNLYGLYYLAYIFGAGVLFHFFSLQSKKREEKILLNLGLLSMLIFTVPTFIFLIFLPGFFVQFPSVLCEFALLLAIQLIIVLWYKERHGLKY
jgi:hypothetical protein